MIQDVILSFLNQKLNINCYLERPAKTPKKWLLIDVIELPNSNHLKQATIIIQSYDETLAKANDLHETLKWVMSDFCNQKEIAKCEYDGGGNFTDSKTKEYRYQATFDVVYY